MSTGERGAFLFLDPSRPSARALCIDLLDRFALVDDRCRIILEHVDDVVEAVFQRLCIRQQDPGPGALA